MKNLFAIPLLAVITIWAVETRHTSPPEEFDVKTWDKNLANIGEGTYMWPYEISNGLYRLFLQNLTRQGNTMDLATATVDSAGWNNELSYGQPFVDYYHSHPAYNHYPVVNVSQEGARIFCVWLTDQYNKTPKRKFSKVQFRLPTAAEWIKAAKAGNELAYYPWGGPSLRNDKGEWLANFKRIDQASVRMDDAGKPVIDSRSLNITSTLNDVIILAPVQSYQPNGYKLYNMAGNAAEWVAEDGMTKGGAWNTTGYYLQIDAPGYWDGSAAADPGIGFRVIMDLIEE